MQNKQLPKLALITGGSSGIGLAISKILAKENIEVIVADKQELQEEFQHIQYYACDVGKSKDIVSLYKKITGEFGHPDVLVINAGRGIQEKLSEGDPDKWQTIIDTNIMGALRTIRAFLPAMLERKHGHVIFISSVAANKPHPYGGIYSATKSALEIIAETLRLETIPFINVTVISPGITDTNFFSNQISGGGSAGDLNMGTISPEEIAEDVLYVLKKRPGTSINKIVTRPIAQEF